MARGRVTKINIIHEKQRRRQVFVQLIAAIAVGTVVCVQLFFKIEVINVAGLLTYSAEEIIEKLDVHVGDNIFLVNDKVLSEMIPKEFPYIEKMTVTRILPKNIEFVVKEVAPAYAVVSDAENYTLLSADFKVLEHKQGRSLEQVPVVMGLDLLDLEPGSNLQIIYDEIKYDKETEFEVKEWYRQAVSGMVSVETLHNETDGLELVGVSYYDVSDPLSIIILYDDRIVIDLGSQLELAYKLKFAQNVIWEMGTQFSGVVNMQTAGSNQRAYTTEMDISPLLHQNYLDGYY